MPRPLTAAGARRSRAAIAVLRELRTALALVADDATARELATRSSSDVILESPLADWLYGSWWAAPSGAVDVDDDGSARGAMRRIAALEAARRRGAGTSPGWLVLAATPKTVMVAPIATAIPPVPLRPLTAQVDRVVDSSRPGTAPAPGDLVALARGESLWDRDQGWWWAHGADDGTVPGDPLDRWYVHARGPAHAAALVRVMIPAFDEVGARYSIKCLPGPHGYGRADALVAYTPRPLTPRVGAALRRRASAIAAHVAAGVVPTTRRVLPGISCAQDPSTGESFGQLRTAQVAALTAIAGLDPVDDDTMAAAAARVGIDLDHPERARA